MSQGIRVYSNAGRLAFSSEFPCFFFKGKITLDRTLPPSGAPTYATAIGTVTSTSVPLVFVKPNSNEDPVCVESIVNIGGNSWRIIASATSVARVSSPISTLTAYVFTRDVVADTGYGINIYSSASTLTFSTKERVLKLAAFCAVGRSGANTFNVPNIPMTFGSVPQGSYAVGQGFYGWRARNIGPPGWAEDSIGAYVNTSNELVFGSTRRINGDVGTITNTYSLLGSGFTPFIDTSLYD